MDEGDFEWGAAIPDLANARNELLVEEIRLLFIHYVIISLFCCTVHCIAILLSLFIQLMFLITIKGHHILSKWKKHKVLYHFVFWYYLDSVNCDISFSFFKHRRIAFDFWYTVVCTSILTINCFSTEIKRFWGYTLCDIIMYIKDYWKVMSLDRNIYKQMDLWAV